MSTIKIIQGEPPHIFHWVDLTNPKEKDYQELSREYSLPNRSIKDSLDPRHLPKYEFLGTSHFIILRAFDEKASPDADSLQELSRKLVIFIGPGHVLSIHRKDQKFIQNLREHWSKPQAPLPETTYREQLLVDLFNAVIASYEGPIDQAHQKLEDLEGKSFLRGADLQTLLEDGYYLKRQLTVTKRVLRLTLEVLNNLLQADLIKKHAIQDLRENAEKHLFLADDILENINTLLHLYISLQSHKTNETMRILTVISVIVLPMNFVAGIYGMNFKIMPELEWTYGYPFSLLLMVLIGTGLFYYSKKKHWI